MLRGYTQEVDRLLRPSRFALAVRFLWRCVTLLFRNPTRSEFDLDIEPALRAQKKVRW